MADPILVKISELETLVSPASADEFVIDDVSEVLLADRTKKITLEALRTIVSDIAAADQWDGSFVAFSWRTAAGAVLAPGTAFGFIYTDTKSGALALPTAAQAEEGIYCEIHIPLQEGVYTVVAGMCKGSDFGIVTAQVDGNSESSVDCYQAGATVYDQHAEFEITIPDTGIHQIRFIASGKNGSSSDYRFGGSLCALYRSGDL